MRSGLILALASSRLALPGGFLRRGLFLGFQADAQRAHQVDDVAGRCPLRRGNGLPHLLFREQFGQRGLESTRPLEYSILVKFVRVTVPIWRVTS